MITYAQNAWLPVALGIIINYDHETHAAIYPVENRQEGWTT